MSDGIDIVRLADELAAIARATHDPATAQHLIALVARLLIHGGLPPDVKDANASPRGFGARV